MTQPEKIEAARRFQRLDAALGRLTGSGETFFEIESTDNAGSVLRPLTPEARAWAAEFLAEMRIDGDDYLVSRAVIGIIFAAAPDRGYLVRFA